MTGPYRRLLWPGVMTAAMLIVLIGLGTWQIKRLFWKQALLAQIAHAEAADPVPLAQLETRSAATGFLPSPFLPSPFMKISITGTFMPDKTALYGAEVRDTASGPTMGAQLIEPLRQAGGEPVLIDRGWVPLTRAHPLEEPAGTVTVSGYVLPGDTPHWFSATDDPSGRHFFTMDPQAIGSAVGLTNIRPFVLIALGGRPMSGSAMEHWPVPARHLPRPPNNHLSYIITWYGLAVALLAIFMIWAKKGSRA